MDNTVMLGLQAAVVAAADASAGMTAVPEGGESFSAVLAAQTGQTGQNVQAGSEQAVQGNAVVQGDQTAEDNMSLPTEETNSVGDLSLEAAEQVSSKSALDVIFEQLEATEDDGTLKGMKILAKAVLNAVMGENGGRKKKTDMFAFMGEGYKLYTEDYDLFLTGTEMLSQIGIALKKDLAAAEEKVSETDAAVVIGADAAELEAADAESEAMSPIDEIISKLDKIVKKLYSADDETDENTAAEALAAMLDIPVETDLDYVFTPVKEQAVEAAAEVLTSAKEIVAEARPEDVPRMEQLYSELTASVKSDKPETEQAQQSYGVHEAFKVSFAAVKINNAADQLKAINGEPTNGTEAAAVMLNPTTVQIGGSVPEAAEASVEVPADPVEIESQVTEKISERLFEMKEDNGTEELIMVLKPENLGQVAVKLIKENGAVSVLLSAQYDEVGKLMAERASNLGGSLQSRDINVKDVNVVDPSNAAEQMGLTFTSQGFSFARNFGGGFSDTNGGGSYRADGVNGVDGEDTTENIEIIKEARSWQWQTIA